MTRTVANLRAHPRARFHEFEGRTVMAGGEWRGRGEAVLSPA